MDFCDYQDNQPLSHFEYLAVGDQMAGQPDSLLKVKKSVFQAMDQLEGWCTKKKASILMDLINMIQPKIVVEIGVFGGKSLIPMGFAVRQNRMGKVYGIDPWLNIASAEGMDGANKKYWLEVNHGAILQGLKAKIREFGLENQIELIRSTSENAPPIDQIDILHIDGNHSEATSYLDVTKWVPLVRKGGIIILDDITWSTTKKAVTWVDEHCIKLAEFKEDAAWGIWVKS